MTYRSWAVHVRRLAVAAVVTAVFAGSAAPAFAAESTTTPTPRPSFAVTTPAPPATPTPSATKVTTDVFTRALAATPPATVPTTSATTPAKAQTSDGFLKTRTGVIVLAIFAVGTGYAIYSAKEDRIHGRNR